MIDEDGLWQQALPRQMSTALASITDVDDMRRLLRDVMTEREIREISARLEAARLLAEGATYADVIKATELSSRTVARVSSWLADGCGGYPIALAAMRYRDGAVRPGEPE